MSSYVFTIYGTLFLMSWNNWLGGNVPLNKDDFTSITPAKKPFIDGGHGITGVGKVSNENL